MAERITVRDLRNIAARLDRMAGLDPDRPIWTKGEDGQNRAEIGRHYIDGAYGGWSLHIIMSESGAVSAPFGGHFPARDLYHMLHAYADGIYRAEHYPKSR